MLGYTALILERSGKIPWEATCDVYTVLLAHTCTISDYELYWRLFFPIGSKRAKGRGRIEMTTLAGPRSQKAVSRCRRLRVGRAKRDQVKDGQGSKSEQINTIAALGSIPRTQSPCVIPPEINHEATLPSKPTPSSVNYENRVIVICRKSRMGDGISDLFTPK